jgi:hypothetical protein
MNVKFEFPFPGLISQEFDLDFFSWLQSSSLSPLKARRWKEIQEKSFHSEANDRR